LKQQNIYVSKKIPGISVSYGCQESCFDIIFKQKETVFDASPGPDTEANKAILSTVLSTLAIPPITDANIFCGGIANIKCPAAMACQLDGSYPDAGGHCTAGKTPTTGLGVKPTDGPTAINNQAVETA